MALDFSRFPFLPALELLRDKAMIPTDSWQEMLEGAHIWGFSVAGATKGDLLIDLHDAVTSHIEEGESGQTFVKIFREIAEKHGWSFKGDPTRRANTILDTNFHSSYSAGRLKQQQALVEHRPFWQYRHGGSMNPRKHHLAWHGMVLPTDDPWWRTHYPPNGYGCKCFVSALSQWDLDRQGLVVDQAPVIETYKWTTKDGREMFVPAGIDPGFDHMPGDKSGADQLQNKIQGWPQELQTFFQEEQKR
ncbi:MAG: hypothetical protein HQL52_03865 [Magnetococcales bacterium]|nr:hypothetical protein [Magnetococcales bacterium]